MMERIRDCKREFLKALSERYGQSEAEAIFREIAREYGAQESDIHLSDEKLGSFAERLHKIKEELLQNRPLQYILGKAWFYGMELSVNASVLIPRPETEELVHQVLKMKRSFPAILDVGTGSGCIALALKNHLPESRVTALDVSEGALKTARNNAGKLGLKLDFIEADIFEWELFLEKDRRFDLIISNPPYIRPSEKTEMHANVLQFEPETALFIEEESPLIFYQYISEMARRHLTVDGVLAFEINQHLGSETVKLMRSKGFTQIELLKDLNGHDRMVIAKF